MKILLPILLLGITGTVWAITLEPKPIELLPIEVKQETIQSVEDWVFNKQDYISPNEWQEIVKAYNTKIQNIKSNCQNDLRCQEIKGVRTVKFEGIKSKKDIIEKLNLWLKEPNTNYIRK